MGFSSCIKPKPAVSQGGQIPRVEREGAKSRIRRPTRQVLKTHLLHHVQSLINSCSGDALTEPTFWWRSGLFSLFLVFSQPPSSPSACLALALCKSPVLRTLAVGVLHFASCPRSFLHRGGRAHASLSGARSRTPSPAPRDSPPAPARPGSSPPPPLASLTLASLHPGLLGSGVPGRGCGGGAELVWEAKAGKANPSGWWEASRYRGSQGSRRGARQRVCAARCPGRGGRVRCSESSERRPSPCSEPVRLRPGTRTPRARRSAERYQRKKAPIRRVRRGETRRLSEWRNNAASRSKAFLEPSLECGVCFLLCSAWALRLLLGLVPPLSLTGIRKLLFFSATFPAKWLSDLRAGSSQDVTF